MEICTCLAGSIRQPETIITELDGCWQYKTSKSLHVVLFGSMPRCALKMSLFFYLSPRRSRLCFFLVKMVRFTQPFFLRGFCLRWRTQRSRWIAALCTYEVAAAALCAWTGRCSTRRDLTISKSSLPNGKQKEEEGSRRYPCNKAWICPCDLWATVIPKAALW